MRQIFRNGSMASLMLSQSGRGNPTMKSKRGLVTVLVGLAMLAMPLAAAAHDDNYNHHDYAHNNSRAARSYAAAHNGAGATWRSATAAAARHEWRADHGYGTVDEYQNYGRNYGGRGYYGAPAYGAPAYAVPAYTSAVPYGGYGGGRNCAKAQRVINTYYRDRNTGHPAAAYDLLAQNRWAFNSGCGGAASYTAAPYAAPYGGGGLLGGLGGLGGYGGQGGYGVAPAYGNYGGYNGGYGGQPYGGGSSFLGPLIQQFVH